MNFAITAAEGRLVADPTYYPERDGDSALAYGRILVNTSVKNAAGKWVELAPTPFNITARGTKAKKLRQFGRGDSVIVCGFQRTKQYRDETTGRTRTSTYLLARTIGSSVDVDDETSAPDPAPAASQSRPAERHPWPGEIAATSRST